MPVTSFRELIVWQKAMDLVETIYRATDPYPTREMFGLTRQIRKAAVSVPSNIAEGQGRHSTQEFLRFLALGRASLQEMQTQRLLCERLGYLSLVTRTDLLDQTTQDAMLINSLVKSLKNRPPL